MSACILSTDGGARGNPGPAGVAFVIHDAAGHVVCSAGRYIGPATNNVAEYQALIWGLENALALEFDEVAVRADSELVVRQILGEYRVKNPNIVPLFARVKELIAAFEVFGIAHVSRAENTEADALANEAMDLEGEVGNPCAGGTAPRQGTLFGEGS